tara:strand:- start:204 stop:851 length:648 start_codon:yes stop_codon:yes gene_type:complete
MYKKRSFFITFEGIEGSGKTYQSKILYKKILNMKIPCLYTREPGGTIGAERIRKIILDDYFTSNSKEKFNKNTDTLLYLAARNEHVLHTLRPAIQKKKIIICDRFTDSTVAYQVYGKKVNANFVNEIHKYILGKIKPDLTFILKANITRALKRLSKRKKKNRYDKFSRNFYKNVQNAFLKIAKSNKKRYFVVDNSFDTPKTEEIILNKFLTLINK